MRHRFLLATGLTLSAMAAELPPAIPDGPITYDETSYDVAIPMADESAVYTGPYAAPVKPSASSERIFELGVNLYSSNYQVRGMGVTNMLSDHGYSSISASYTHPNRNLFNKGVYAKAGAQAGAIWGAGDALGDIPQFGLYAGLGKEIAPNLKLEAGYSLRRGGLEGFMARFHNGARHRTAHDISVTLSYNDHQRGFFGHATWGYGFKGLTGHFFDFEGGYRFMDVLRGSRLGADLELSAGIAPSFGYWAGGVEGIDAYRIKAVLLPFTHSGTLGRDAAWQVKPWIQCSWSGNNASKIDRMTGCGPVDHFQITLGVEAGYSF